MKKTLIALVALSGVAAGMTAQQFNTAVGNVVTATQYEYGYQNSWTLTFTLSNNPGQTKTLLTMAKPVEGQENSAWYLLTQGGSYTGVSVASDKLVTVGSDSGNWQAATTRSEGKSHWLVDAAQRSTLNTWLTYSYDSSTDTYASANPSANGMQVTLTSNPASTTLTLQLTNGTTSSVEVLGYQLNAADLSLGADFTVSSATFEVYTPYTEEKYGDSLSGNLADYVNYTPAPEPTTATLSLLALAALAARRRRK